MWIFTKYGFVSAVQHRDDAGTLLVRARDRQSLVRLAHQTDTTIQRTPTADYPYRVTVSRYAFAQWVEDQIHDLRYPNFKSEVYVTRGAEFAEPLHEIWSVMHDVEDDNARAKAAV